MAGMNINCLMANGRLFSGKIYRFRKIKKYIEKNSYVQSKYVQDKFIIQIF